MELKKHKLAILLPAYKPDFLDAALASIANQTCKDFTLYVGDDASEFELNEIIKKYKDKISLVYKRFSENLGGKDLIAQWNRVFGLTRDEEWVWMFSDDDVMQASCVEDFYSELNKNNNFDLFHFNVDVINPKGEVIESPKPYPKTMATKTFLKQRLEGNLFSFVVEYIFRKDSFVESGLFENFDLAWNADDATWLKLAHQHGIKTISNSKVLWRRSSENISEQNSKAISKRKIDANLEYFKWLKAHSISKDFPRDEWNNMLNKKFMDQLFCYSKSLSFQEVLEFIKKYKHTINNNFPVISNAGSLYYRITKNALGKKARSLGIYN